MKVESIVVYNKVNNNNRIGDSMKDILHHLLGTCGESHISVLTLYYLGVFVIYKELLVEIAREVKNALFK